MGGLLQHGQWIQKSDWEKGDGDAFERQTSSFRDHISAQEDAAHPATPDRYHLYVSYACPWAHRTLCVRALMGLEEVLPISVVHPFMGDEGWHFGQGEGVVADPIYGVTYLRELYLKANPTYTGRVTVPVLWDRQAETIVNNESRDIIRMFCDAMAPLATRQNDLCPQDLRQEVDQAIDTIYEPINNGVYKCGFAGSQDAYDRAFDALFEALDHWDKVLGSQRYVCGDRLTEADLCLFTTLLRFDPVYYVHFKCNRQHVYEYENLWGFLKEILQIPGIAATCNFHHIKTHYYTSHPQLNPKGLVPVGPQLDRFAPHGRGRLSAKPVV